jgi:hypothetical protein
MSQKLNNLVVAGLSSLGAAQSYASSQEGPIIGQHEPVEIQAQDGLIEIQAQWIKVPQRCKDRSVTSDPVRVGPEQVSAAVTNIHGSLGTV